MYKALEVDFQAGRNMLIVMNSDNEMKRSVKLLELYKVSLRFPWCSLLLIQRGMFSLNVNSLFDVKLETTGGVIQNMETVYWQDDIETKPFSFKYMFRH